MSNHASRLAAPLLLSLLFLIIYVVPAVAQDTTGSPTDTIALDTTENREQIEQQHSPLKATIMSAVLPGLGQVYNKKYWKVPIIYAGFAGGGYAITYVYGEYQAIQEAITAKSNGTIIANNFYYNRYSLQGLQQIQRTYRKWLDISIIGTSVWYILNIIDANVDAHLYYFDVSDDLSMQLNPAYQFAGNRAYQGVQLRIQLKGNSTSPKHSPVLPVAPE